MNGIVLLAEYRQTGSERAFAELVRQYTNLVYSVALRRLSDSQGAEDVVQAVFMRLAAAKPKLGGEAELSAWLHRTTVHVAIDVWRRETRRRNREQQAFAMEPSAPETPEPWELIAPALDVAINQLGATDRQALLMRFFQRKSMREVGESLGVNENAAKMRVSRALERLRSGLALPGAVCTAATLSTLLLTHSVEAAPSQLVARLVTVKFLSAGATSAFGIFSLLYQPLMLMSKFKLATLIGLALLGLTLIGIHSALRSSTRPDPVPKVARSILMRPRTASPRPVLFERNRGIVDSLATLDPNALEQAKKELRALLERPPKATGYPPRALCAALAKFGYQRLQAMPILLERLDIPDFETRHWALFGVRELMVESWGTEAFTQALALARPKLSPIFRSEEEPLDLRRAAFQALVPSGLIVERTLEGPKFALLDADTVFDLTAVLQSSAKKTQGFRFELVDDFIRRHISLAPQDDQILKGIVNPLVQSDNFNQRFLAAFALASLPGDKPSAIKDILVEELQLGGTPEGDNSYYAARGLGRLGPDAKDAVPALLEFASATKTWAAGYVQEALEAVCRIQPELRGQYPEIDAKLKQEAEAALPKAQVKTSSMSEVTATLANPETGPQMLSSLADQIQNATDPAQQKSQVLAWLETMRQQSAESQRAAIQKAMDTLRAIPDQPPAPAPAQHTITITSLTLDAQVLLLENPSVNDASLQALVNQWYEYSRNNPAAIAVTPERFQALSEAIKGIDPRFHETWLEQVLRTYPSLDRVIKR